MNPATSLRSWDQTAPRLARASRRRSRGFGLLGSILQNSRAKSLTQWAKLMGHNPIHVYAIIDKLEENGPWDVKETAAKTIPILYDIEQLTGHRVMPAWSRNPDGSLRDDVL